MRTSFIELRGRERAQALLDEGSFVELLGPFDQLESPHLAPQGIVPESDDGVIIAKGFFNSHPVVILSMEGAFQGGGIGEVCGTKIAASLERVLTDNKEGRKTIPIIIFDTGGVRLQEANYGLLIISEMQSAIVALRKYVPVIGLIPGNVGCFGGMSITAALCSELIVTSVARFGLNGPEVIEQEAGVQEFNSKDRRMIWDTIGGIARLKAGLVDQLVEDDISEFKKAIRAAMKKHREQPRTQQIDRFLALIGQADPVAKGTKEPIKDAQTPSRGRTWFTAFTGSAAPLSDFPGVLAADTVFFGQPTRFLAVVPNTANHYPRARHGEVGLQEGWELAKYIRQAIEEDAGKPIKRNLVAVIDSPSQAYGYLEELLGVHYACAASADAYATARQAGHHVTGIVVGDAISGAFLAHGLQSSRMIALNDKKINVQAMSKQSAARITKRTIAELEEATKKVPATAYDVTSFYSLGALDVLVDVVNADEPDAGDVTRVSLELLKAINDGDGTLRHRLETKPAVTQGRLGSIAVRHKLAEQWK
jgi:malonate decarboxylase beta subunit